MCACEVLLHRSATSIIEEFSYSYVREYGFIRPYRYSKTASTNALSDVHSKLDYCNSLYYSLVKYPELSCMHHD